MLQLETKGITQPRSPRVLTTQLLQTLLSILQQRPLLGHTLLQSLNAKSEHEQYKKNNKVLQLLYIKAISGVLDKISHPTHPVLETEGNLSENEVENPVSSLDNNLQSLYQILSMFNPNPYENYSEIREIFGRLLELSGGEIPKLNRKSLLSALIGGKEHYLVLEFLKLEYEIYVKTNGFPPNIRDDDATEETKVMLKVSKEKDVRERMHHMFLRCYINKEHFLYTVVVRKFWLFKRNNLMSYPCLICYVYLILGIKQLEKMM